MRTRMIGSLEVSVVALGCNNFNGGFDQDVTDEVVHAALECGVNFLDTAENYGGGRSEEVVGRAIAGRREDVVVATKYDGHPDTVRDHLEASLRRLGVDYVDLYTLHHPVPGVPVEETLGALGELSEKGLIREFGCSNVDATALREAAAVPGRHHFAAVQNDYNLLNRKMEFEVLPYCAATGLAFTAYFPLYHGLLTGDFHRGEPPKAGSRIANASQKRRDAILTGEHFDVLEALENFSATRGKTLLDIALARLIAEPGVAAVIPGAASAAHVRANTAAADWVLSSEDIEAIDRLAPADPRSPDTPSSATGY